MVQINVGNPKMAREALSAAQNGLSRSGKGTSLSEYQSARIQKMIDQLDVIRPLNPDGKHTLHTATCGCEDSYITLCKHCKREIVMVNDQWHHIHHQGDAEKMNGRCYRYVNTKLRAEPIEWVDIV